MATGLQQQLIDDGFWQFVCTLRKDTIHEIDEAPIDEVSVFCWGALTNICGDDDWIESSVAQDVVASEQWRKQWRSAVEHGLYPVLGMDSSLVPRF